MSVCESEADDFENAMTLGVCHEIDGCAGHMTAPNDLTPDKGLETFPPGFGMLNIRALVDVRPINQLGGRELGAVWILCPMPCPVVWVSGDPCVALTLGGLLQFRCSRA